MTSRIDEAIDIAARFYNDWQLRRETDSQTETCGTCHRCEVPKKGIFTDETVGFCRDAGEFVHTDANPYHVYGCESWVSW